MQRYRERFAAVMSEYISGKLILPRDTLAIEFTDHFAVARRIDHQAETVRCIRKSLETLVRCACSVDFVAHAAWNEQIGLTVNEQNRIFASDNSSEGIGLGQVKFTEQAGAQLDEGHREGSGQFSVFLTDLANNGFRRGERTVRYNADHVAGQIELGGHQNRSGAHGNAGE